MPCVFSAETNRPVFVRYTRKRGECRSAFLSTYASIGGVLPIQFFSLKHGYNLIFPICSQRSQKLLVIMMQSLPVLFDSPLIWGGIDSSVSE